MPQMVNIHHAKTHLSELLGRVMAGEEIIIAKAGKPRARLVAIPAQKRPRLSTVMGKNLLGVTYMAPDFDEDLPLEMLLGEGKVSS